MRPRSIAWFERAYLGAWAIGLVNTTANWNRTLGRVQSSTDGTFPPGLLYVLTAIGFAIPLLLWFFIARRASVVAKWILVALFVLGLIGIAISATTGTIAGGLPGLLAVVATLMQAVAIWLLFQPDAAAWFAQRRTRGAP